jgi:hypothetical protein
MSDGNWAVLDGFRDPIVLQARIAWLIFATRSATLDDLELGSEKLNPQHLP